MRTVFAWTMLWSRARKRELKGQSKFESDHSATIQDHHQLDDPFEHAELLSHIGFVSCNCWSKSHRSIESDPSLYIRCAATNPKQQFKTSDRVACEMSFLNQGSNSSFAPKARPLEQALLSQSHNHKNRHECSQRFVKETSSISRWRAHKELPSRSLSRSSFRLMTQTQLERSSAHKCTMAGESYTSLQESRNCSHVSPQHLTKLQIFLPSSSMPEHVTTYTKARRIVQQKKSEVK